MALVILYHLLMIAGHQGNPTALFCAGDQFAAPPYLAGQVYQFSGSTGFDGQFYLYIAHDPLNVRDTAAFVDSPSTRWKRILFPGLAALLSMGRDSLVIPAYIGLMWLTVFLGIFVLARLSLHWGYPALLGLSFLAIPAVAVSIDRMMTDIGIVVALLVLLLAMEEDSPSLAIAALALAPLARETGVVFIGAWMLWYLWKRDWLRVGIGAVASIPFLSWATWIHMQFGSDGVRWWGWPFEGILARLGTYTVYPAPLIGNKLALFLDYLGAWGIAASFLIGAFLLLRGERSMLLLSAVLYTAGISIFAKEDMWSEAYSYTRTGGPTAVMLALLGVRQRRWWLVVPMALAIPRVALQYVAMLFDSLRNIGS